MCKGDDEEVEYQVFTPLHVTRLVKFVVNRSCQSATTIVLPSYHLTEDALEYVAQEKMEGRKWEEMNMDCLVNVFGRVGIESLLLDVPFVCKSWYKATLSPLCWQTLVFPSMSHFDSFTHRVLMWVYEAKCKEVEYQVFTPLHVTRFVKFVVNRSCRSATTIVLPSYHLTEDALEYVAQE
ncbi:unnamed protein product [Camellia sinensis]